MNTLVLQKYITYYVWHIVSYCATYAVLQIVDLCLKYISYDPNYNYDDDDETDEMEVDEEEDDDLDDDYRFVFPCLLYSIGTRLCGQTTLSFSTQLE